MCLIIITICMGRAETRNVYPCFTDKKIVFPKRWVIGIVQTPIERPEFSVILFMVTKSLFKVPEHGSHPSRKASLLRLRRGLLLRHPHFQDFPKPLSKLETSAAADRFENDAVILRFFTTILPFSIK